MKTNDELIKILKALPKGTEIQCTHSTAAIYAVGKDGRPYQIFDFFEGKGLPTDEMKASGSASVIILDENLNFGDKSFSIIGKPIKKPD